jgi:hypothetical protein
LQPDITSFITFRSANKLKAPMFNFASPVWHNDKKRIAIVAEQVSKQGVQPILVQDWPQ